MKIEKINIPCKHWKEMPHMNGGGKCLLGKYGGYPGYSRCLRDCPDYDGPDREQIKAPIDKFINEGATIVPMSIDGNKITIDNNADKVELSCPGCNKTKKKNKRTLIDMARGAVGITKEALGIDAADDKEVEDRWNTCGSCIHNVQGICDDCGCHLSAKVRIKSEKCPKELW